MREAISVQRPHKKLRDGWWRKNQIVRMFQWMELERDFTDASDTVLHNPVVSFSTSLDHALRYADGLKSYHDATDVTYIHFDQADAGEAQVLGRLQPIRLPAADMQQPHIHHVQQLNAAGRFNINPHILSEVTAPNSWTSLTVAVFGAHTMDEFDTWKDDLCRKRLSGSNGSDGRRIPNIGQRAASNIGGHPY